MTVSAQRAEGQIVIDLKHDGRYARQELISWWNQERLRAARVLVVGAGALGNEVLKNLALLGVGTILVADLDVIENSNLSRCVLFDHGDEGLPKAEVAAAAARRLNPDVNVIPVVGDVRRTLGLGVFGAVDVVIGGLDNREARVHTNQACWKVSVPWIDGAIEGLMGIMRAFVPPASACYECTLTDRDYRLMAARKACSLLTREQMLGGKVPTVATTGSIIAAMQVQEAVKLIHDPDSYAFGGHGFVYNGHTHDSYKVTYPRREECLSHDTYAMDSTSRVSPQLTFGTFLETYGSSDAVLELECELVTAFVCTRCTSTSVINRIALGLSAADAICATCGHERRVEATHRIGADTPQLLGLTPQQVGLPAFDVISVRADGERRAFVVGGQGDPLEYFAR